MRIILLEDVERLGKRGAVVNVSDGYGRNFLLPRKLAVVATETNMKQIEQTGKRQKIVEAKESKDAMDLKADLEKVTIAIAMKSGEGDMLFGSVTGAHVAEELEKLGYKIDKRRIEVDEPIKRLGEYEIPVRLHKDVIATVKLNVLKE
ncbi:MAG TPA: 50S ribosomal protein L9 [Acidobacteriota bacterium]|nr:50S ribosomal protein L9 [Acidobacteriota bacterium]